MKKEKLTLERNLNIFFWGSFLSLIVTGIINFATDFHSSFLLWMNIFHVINGIIFTITVALYIFTHLKRTMNYRRPLAFITGLIASLILAIAIISGLLMLWRGRQEIDAFIFNLHLYATCIAVTLIFIHLLFYVLTAFRTFKETNLFPSIDSTVRKYIGYFVILMSLFMLSANFISQSSIKVYSEQSAVTNYKKPYGKHPFRPSETESYHGKFIDQQQIANSKECMVCHETISQQWMDSVHKKAASDPAYVKNINLLSQKKGISSTRYCEGCHSPIALLTGELSPGGQHGGQAGSLANTSGVNCLSCHGISNIQHTKGNASFKFSPSKSYLFQDSANKFLSSINRLSIKLAPTQHKADMARDLITSSEFCSTCHAQFMDKEMNNWGWVKMQDDYESWLGSSFADKKTRFKQDEIKTCQDCHMPLVKGRDPSENNLGQIKSHRFLGANTLTALFNRDDKHLKETIKFLQQDKMRIVINIPNRNDATQDRQASLVDSSASISAPYFYYLNEEVDLDVLVSNVGVGHGFPGGSIDINQAWIEVTVTDGQGKEIFKSGFIDQEGFVDKSAYFYRSIPVDRNGKDVWKHDLFNMVGKRYQNTVPAGSTDLVNYNFVIPSWALTPVSISVSLNYRKLNQRYLNWIFDGNPPQLPVVDMARDILQVPIKEQKEAF